jgi:hypothetical protein
LSSRSIGNDPPAFATLLGWVTIDWMFLSFMYRRRFTAFCSHPVSASFAINFTDGAPKFGQDFEATV